MNRRETEIVAGFVALGVPAQVIENAIAADRAFDAAAPAFEDADAARRDALGAAERATIELRNALTLFENLVSRNAAADDDEIRSVYADARRARSRMREADGILDERAEAARLATAAFDSSLSRRTAAWNEVWTALFAKEST